MSKELTKYFQQAKIWQAEMQALRDILLQTGLDETLKWQKPCYCHQGRNIVIIQPFKNCLGLMFFKGTLLKDPKKILVPNGPNSQSASRLEFTTVAKINQQAKVIKSYIKEAIAIEESGQKVITSKSPPTIPAELTAAFKKSSKLKKAFYELTPGRQRAYILHFSGAKQATTRKARIERYIDHILAGKGFNDR